MPAKMSEIESIITHAKEIFKKLKENHQGPKSFLVFSSRFGQGGLKSGIDLFIEFPEMFLPEEVVNKVSVKLKEKKKIGKLLSARSEEIEKRMRDLKGNFLPSDDKELRVLKDQIKVIENDIYKLMSELVVKEDVFVEIRFEQLNFEFIQALKNDPLVSQEWTVKEGRSIRVVLFRVNEVED